MGWKARTLLPLVRCVDRVLLDLSQRTPRQLSLSPISRLAISTLLSFSLLRHRRVLLRHNRALLRLRRRIGDSGECRFNLGGFMFLVADDLFVFLVPVRFTADQQHVQVRLLAPSPTRTTVNVCDSSIVALGLKYVKVL